MTDESFTSPTAFLSGSGDVDDLLQRACDRIEELQARLHPGNRIDPYYWNYEHWNRDQACFTFDQGFQAAIMRPSAPDVRLGIFVFGERVGTPLGEDFPLPEDFHLPEDVRFRDRNSQAPLSLTGTMFEFFDLLHANRQRRAAGEPTVPVLLFFLGEAERIRQRARTASDRGWGNRRLRTKIMTADLDESVIDERREDYRDQLRQLAFFFDNYIERGGAEGHASPAEFVGDEAAFMARLDLRLTNLLQLNRKRPFREVIKGLLQYQPEDSDVYFGRDEAVKQIVEGMARMDAETASGRDSDRPGGAVRLVTGPSGAGKSSFLRAGVLAKLRAGHFRTAGGMNRFAGAVTTPDDLVLPHEAVSRAGTGEQQPEDPAWMTALISANLAQLLTDEAGLDLGPDPVAALAGKSPEAQIDFLVGRLATALEPGEGSGKSRRPGRLVLVLDQCERPLDEIKDPARTEADNAHWRHLLSLLARLRKDLGAWLLFAVPDGRDALWDQVAASVPGLKHPEYKFTLSNPDHAQLDAIRSGIEGQTGLEIDPEWWARFRSNALALGSPDVGGVAHQTKPASLPLISQTLLRYFEREEKASNKAGSNLPADPALAGNVPDAAGLSESQKSFGQSTRSDDKETEDLADLGVTIAALGEEAISTVFSRQSLDETGNNLDEPLGKLLRRLVSVVGKDYRRLRVEDLTSFQADGVAYFQDAEAFVQALLDCRLLVQDRKNQIRLSHETILDYWPRAQKWYQDALVELALIGRVSEAAEAWEEADRCPTRLNLAGIDLFRLGRLLARWRDRLSDRDQDFIYANLRCHYDPREELPGLKPDQGGCMVFLTDANEKALFFDILDHLGLAVTDLDRDPGWTPLAAAANIGNADFVATLLEQGARTEVRLEGGETPLHLASLNGYEDVVGLILSSGAEVNAQSKTGWTALHMASRAGHEGVVALLLSSGAEVNVLEEDDWTALHLASRNGHEGVVGLLLSSSGIDVDARKKDGWTALHLATLGEHERVVALLLSSAADVNAQEEDGWTALHLASRDGHEGAAALLLSSAADVNAQGEDGWTALHLASRAGHEGAAALLLSSGVDVNAQKKDGWTALHLACFNDHKGVMYRLIAAGAKIIVETKIGRTPLHLATYRGLVDMVEKMVIETAKLKATVLCRQKAPFHSKPDFLLNFSHPAEDKLSLTDIDDSALTRYLEKEDLSAAGGWPVAGLPYDDWCDPGETARNLLLRRLLGHPESPLQLPLGERDRIIGLRVRYAPYYPGHLLCELAIERLGQYGLVNFLYGETAGLQLFNHTSEVIHGLNSSVPICLDTSTVRDYLIFFCGLLMAETGTFKIIWPDVPIAWRPEVGGEMRDRLSSLPLSPPSDPVWQDGVIDGDNTDSNDDLKPGENHASDGKPVKNPDPVKRPGWRMAARILYGKDIFLTQFLVEPDGMVLMLEDECLMEDLPVLPEFIDGVIRWV